MNKDFNYLNKRIIRDKKVIKGLINKQLCLDESSALIFIEISNFNEFSKKGFTLEVISNILDKNKVFFSDVYRWHDESYFFLADRVYEGDLKVIVKKIKKELQEIEADKELNLFLGAALITPRDSMETAMDRLFNNISKIN